MSIPEEAPPHIPVELEMPALVAPLANRVLDLNKADFYTPALCIYLLLEFGGLTMIRCVSRRKETAE